MCRDLFRGLIRTALVLCLIASCCETFYFMGELSKNTTQKYDPYRYSRNNYYGRSSTYESEEIEDIDDYEQDTARAYSQQEYEY